MWQEMQHAWGLGVLDSDGGGRGGGGKEKRCIGRGGEVMRKRRPRGRWECRGPHGGVEVMVDV